MRGEAARPSVTRLRRIEPTELWGSGDLPARLAAILAPLALVAAESESVHLALFSWGEATHAALGHAA